ncbi:hypothetical protein Tco_0663186, partial [Tanacetum coccineum]
ETFNFLDDHTKETSSGSTTTHADISLSEYDLFHLDSEPDSGDFTIDVMEDIFDNPTREPKVHVPNVLPTHPTLHMDFNFIPSHNDLGSDLDVSSPSGDRNRIYDPGICIEVESTRFLTTHSPMIDTLLPFSSENKDKVFNHGVLASKEKSTPSSSHRGFKASKLFHQKSPMLIYGEDIPILDVLIARILKPLVLMPYDEDASPTAQSPDYVLESNPEADLEDDDDEDPKEDHVDYPADVGDDGDDEEGSSEDDEDDDMDIEADDEEEEEEHLAPADSIVVALPTMDQAPSVKEKEPFETDESAATPPPHPAYRMTARISIPAPAPTPIWSDAEVAKLLAISTPPSSSLSPWSSPLPYIPFPSLPLSPPSLVLSPVPPPSPIFPTSSPPLLQPSASHREDRPEVTLPPRKRLDYDFVATIDREIRHDPEREVGYGITDSWDEIVETLQLLDESVQYVVLEDRRAYAYYTSSDGDLEARLSPRGLSAIDAMRCDLPAEERRLAMIKMLKAEYLGRSASELRTADRTQHQQLIQTLIVMHSLQGQVTTLQGHVTALQGQVTALQGQQGPARGPTQPELPEEAGSSS